MDIIITNKITSVVANVRNNGDELANEILNWHSKEMEKLQVKHQNEIRYIQNEMNQRRQQELNELHQDLQAKHDRELAEYNVKITKLHKKYERSRQMFQQVRTMVLPILNSSVQTNSSKIGVDLTYSQLNETASMLHQISLYHANDYEIMYGAAANSDHSNETSSCQTDGMQRTNQVNMDSETTIGVTAFSNRSPKLGSHISIPRSTPQMNDTTMEFGENEVELSKISNNETQRNEDDINSTVTEVSTKGYVSDDDHHSYDKTLVNTNKNETKPTKGHRSHPRVLFSKSKDENLNQTFVLEENHQCVEQRFSPKNVSTINQSPKRKIARISFPVLDANHDKSSQQLTNSCRNLRKRHHTTECSIAFSKRCKTSTR